MQTSINNASRQGRLNRAEGAEFEKLIERSCEYYREKGIALIEKTPEPIRILTKVDNHGTFKACFIKQAQPDFKGTLKGGKAIAFDAKCTMTDKIPISALSDEQVKCLTMHENLGAISGVLMSYGFKTCVFMTICKFLNAKEIVGHKHWTAYEAIRYGQPVRFTGTIIDFLEVVKCTMQ
jgi:recombination protein U